MEKQQNLSPDYDNSIVNVTASILKHYGVAPPHSSLKPLDAALEADYRNVVLLVLDGLGSENLKELLPENCFLARHKTADITSVFPTTTTAALTSIQTGLTPLEHGWLGWELYFESKRKNLELFENYGEVSKIIPVTDAFRKIKSAKYYALSPFGQGKYRSENLVEIAANIKTLTAKRGKKLIYAYSSEPDGTLHDYGGFAHETKNLFEGINNLLERLRRELRDTLLIVTADHGHIDTKRWIDTNKIEGLSETLRVPSPVMEPRATGFFVKQGKEADFLHIMSGAIGEKGFVLSRKEAEPLFGKGNKNPNFDALLGDFVVVMNDDTNLWDMRAGSPCKSMHSGLTKRELEVPLITVACP